MFAVAQVYRLGVSIKRGGDELAVGPDEHALNARRCHQGDHLDPRLKVEGLTFHMHFGGDEFHRGADAVEMVPHFIRKAAVRLAPSDCARCKASCRANSAEAATTVHRT